MTGILQSGSITSGHLMKWVSDGVAGDAGSPLGLTTVIGQLLDADFSSTLDQAITLDPNVLAFQIAAIYVTRASVSLGTAVGGFYPAANKAGTAIVSAGQVYSSLTSAATLLSCTLAGGAATTRYTRSNLTAWTIYFSLTTPQAAAATADIYILGTPLAR